MEALQTEGERGQTQVTALQGVDFLRPGCVTWLLIDARLLEYAQWNVSFVCTLPVLPFDWDISDFFLYLIGTYFYDMLLKNKISHLTTVKFSRPLWRNIRVKSF